MAYKRTSHLSATPITNGYTEVYVPPITPDFTKTNEFTLTQKYDRRPDLLAYEMYGDAKFWWVFVLYNKNQLRDPINDFRTGLTLLIPTRNFIAGF